MRNTHTSKQRSKRSTHTFYRISQQPNIEDTYEQIIEQPHTTKILRTTILLAHDEPPSWITPSLNFLTSQPSKQPPSDTSFCFPQPQSHHDNTSSGMDSDTNSNTTAYNTISQFNNSDLETPDKFDNSEPSPSTFSQPPFQPLHSQI